MSMMDLSIRKWDEKLVLAFMYCFWLMWLGCILFNFLNMQGQHFLAIISQGQPSFIHAKFWIEMKSSKDCLHIQKKIKWTKWKDWVSGTYSRSNPRRFGSACVADKNVEIHSTAAERITWPCWWVMWSAGVFSLQQWWGVLWVCVFEYAQREKGTQKSCKRTKPTEWACIYFK